MSLLREMSELDELTLRAHAESAGDCFDITSQQSLLERTISRSEIISVYHRRKLVAYAALEPQQEGTWFVTAFNTHPNHRNAAIFRKLFSELAKVIEKYHVNFLVSHVYKANDLSVNFHRRLGFEITNENKKAWE